MKRHHPPIVLLAASVLFIGLSISGGPVVWAVLVMAAPVFIMFYLAGRGVSHPHEMHVAPVRHPEPRRPQQR